MDEKELKERARHSNKKYRDAHLEKTRRDVRKWNHRLKLEVFNAYSVEGRPHCVQCGTDDLDVLCIDHVFMRGNAHRRSLKIGSGAIFYHWLKKNNFPEGFQILCFNCNHKKEVVRLRAQYQDKE